MPDVSRAPPETIVLTTAHQAHTARIPLQTPVPTIVCVARPPIPPPNDTGRSNVCDTSGCTIRRVFLVSHLVEVRRTPASELPKAPALQRGPGLLVLAPGNLSVYCRRPKTHLYMNLSILVRCIHHTVLACSEDPCLRLSGGLPRSCCQRSSDV